MEAMTERSGLSGRIVLVCFLVGGGAVFGLSVLVGFLGPKHGFQWELASIFGTALGTTLLAAATGALAFSTWSDVRATWRLADLTRRDQDERQRPVVLQQDVVFQDAEAQAGWLIVTLRNVGLGPALRVEVTADYANEEFKPTFAPNPYVFPAIAPGESLSFQTWARFDRLPPDGVKADAFPLSGTFTDRSQEGSYEIITKW